MKKKLQKWQQQPNEYTRKHIVRSKFQSYDPEQQRRRRRRRQQPQQPKKERQKRSGQQQNTHKVESLRRIQ